METLTPDRMRTLHGMKIDEGEVCGLMVGALSGAIYFSWTVPAAFIFMFTPMVCVLDYGLR